MVVRVISRQLGNSNLPILLQPKRTPYSESTSLSSAELFALAGSTLMAHMPNLESVAVAQMVRQRFPSFVKNYNNENANRLKNDQALLSTTEVEARILDHFEAFKISSDNLFSFVRSLFGPGLPQPKNPEHNEAMLLALAHLARQNFPKLVAECNAENKKRLAGNQPLLSKAEVAKRIFACYPDMNDKVVGLAEQEQRNKLPPVVSKTHLALQTLQDLSQKKLAQDDSAGIFQWINNILDQLATLEGLWGDKKSLRTLPQALKKMGDTTSFPYNMSDIETGIGRIIDGVKSLVLADEDLSARAKNLAIEAYEDNSFLHAQLNPSVKQSFKELYTYCTIDDEDTEEEENAVCTSPSSPIAHNAFAFARFAMTPVSQAIESAASLEC
jgi:hypothetical protein